MDLLLTLVLFLILAKLAGELAEKINMPPVMGELGAGILIGPSLLHIVTPSEFTDVLGDIGIIILLFLAGLDTDISDLRKSGKPSSLAAIGGVILPMGLGFGAATLLGFSQTESVFIGAILTATSVGITVRTLIDMKKLNTPLGMTILGAAVIDDVIGILILTVLGSLATFSLLGFFGVVGKVLIFFILALYLGFKFMPSIMGKIQRLSTPEALLSFSLIFVLGLSLIAKGMGLSEIIGAFFAGIILHRVSQEKVISEKVYSIGYSFFIPIFFVNIGVETDIGAVLETGLLAIAILAVAIIGKIIGSGLGAKLGGFSYTDSLKVGIGMVPRMEVALIIARAGMRLGTIGESVFSITIVLVIATTIITPLLLKATFKQ
ncbi:MAG: cation:proton antiporter [Euryarchaeota archaeon]|nr:cation:proton antiporter [Euryarchaeota archaeon]